MGEKLIIGPFNKGLQTNREPFVIDNDSFPTLINAFQWRGRIKRKRGTSLLTRLTRFFNSTISSYTSTSSFNLSSGSGNLITGFSLQSNSTFVPGSISLTVAGNVYTDPSLNGILVGTPVGSGTINYANGAITIAGGAGSAVSGSFRYYPDLPVMGLEDLNLNGSQFPNTMGFDTIYSYIIQQNTPYNSYDVSFYKNPSASASLPGYVSKTNETPTTWNGQDYQQFWTVNYQGALWATNGINVPFSITNIGMQYKSITTVTVTSGGPPAIVTLTINGHGLVIGDFLFINEVVSTTGINFQTGYVINVIDANNVSVEFPNATIATNGSGGIAQYLTNRSDITKDCIRFYDGDPTNQNAINPSLTGNNGWVNFAPPLSQSNFSIADLPAAQYYLVGARMIVAYKNRLLFLGAVVQTSAAGSQVYLPDTIVYSQAGTPYYTASYTNKPSATADTPSQSNIVFNPILVPINQTATSTAYFSDQTGFGGNISDGSNEPIISASMNEDVLIVGFNTFQTRLVYSGDDVNPFLFYTINSELGSSSTFSMINMNDGVLTRGTRGYIITNQVGAQRIDLDIPDQVFEIQLVNNGNERICAQRDFIKEWIYFTYPSNEFSYKFPNQTLLFNYRDNSWGIFNETYTTYGSFRKSSGLTWGTVGNVYPTWGDWDVPWNSGSTTLFQPDVIAGNQQGFILVRQDDTNEGNSLYIQNISTPTITSPNHCLNNGDYITISNVLGTIGTNVNNNIFSVANATTNTFDLNPPPLTGTYLGSGLIKRMYVPEIQTKQFPTAWQFGRKTRIGFQQYLLSKTNNAQIQLFIFISQDDTDPYNNGPIFPDPNSENDGLIYSTVLYTCPESLNLGLTPANVNLQQLNQVSESSSTSSNGQQQIWHRVNTSLIGDTVQLGFTLSDSQMRTVDANGNPISQFSEIEIHGIIMDISPSMWLS